MLRYELLEEDLKDYNYQTAEPSKNGDHIAENYTTPYPMVKTYYEVGEGQYPNRQDGYFVPAGQDEFVTKMYDKCLKYSEGEHSKRFKNRHRPAWEERFRRSWASFTRDVHFSFLMASSNIFENTKYSIEEDRKNNADLICEIDDEVYYINLFIDSQKGREKLEQKLNSGKDRNDIIVPLNPKGYKKTIRTKGDDLWLFSNEHINKIHNLIRKGDNEAIIEHRIENTKIEIR